jgi:hypothetical protein
MTRSRRSRTGAPIAGPVHRNTLITATVLLVFMAVAVIAHDPGQMLHHPLWRDENWVAVSVRAPLARVPALTSTTPLLFSLLLRITPHSSPQGLRVLPLAFTALSVVPAWLLGREIDRDRWLTRVVLAATVAVLPAMLVRHDLKQYTAEAFDALLLAWLLTRVEREWSRARLWLFGAAAAASFLLSNAAPFIGAAGFVALLAVAAVGRDMRKLLDLALVGTAALVATLVVFVTVAVRGDTPSLRAYWDGYYIPTDRGVAAAVHVVGLRAGAELDAVGVGRPLVALALVMLGVAVLLARRLPALALVVPLICVEQIAGAATRVYPLWDARTSTWFTALLGVLAAGGIAGVVGLVVHRGPTGRRWSSAPSRLLAAAACLGVVVAVAIPFWHADVSAIQTTTPAEDVAGQVRTILADRGPGDVVLANTDAGFGLGVYWPAPPEFIPGTATMTTFHIAYPASNRIVVVPDISTAADIAAVRRAVVMAAAHGGRIWVVLSHVHVSELATLVGQLLRYGTFSTPPGQRGTEAVRVLTLRSATGSSR